ncbi:MAG TPA: Gmad2 immunoglobulin-like domain-containing protein [Actinomycetales bacterium]|nr:Gmad2 immunoglobulin-like domain-containing protein [Actinomycetales bacterium]
MPPSPYRAAPARPRALVAVITGALVLAVLGGEPFAGPTPAPPAAPATVAADVVGPPDAEIAPASVVTPLGPVDVPPARGPADPAPVTAGTGPDAAGAAPAAAPVAPGPSGLPVDPAPEQVPDVVTGTLARAYAEIGHVDESGEPADAGVVAAREGENPGLLTWIHTADGLAIRVPTPQLRDIPEGATVRVELGGRRGAIGSDPRGDEHSGYEILKAEVLALPATEQEPTSASGAGVMAAAAPHQVTVVLVAPAGQSKDGTTLATVVSAVESGASGFWSQQTGGAVSFDVVKAVDWITTSASCASYSSLWSQVADRVGWTAGAGRHLLLYVPSAGSPSGCYAGLGTVGSGPSSGGRAYVRSTSTAIIAHELGHNMGLGHSDGLLCPGVSDGAYSSGWRSGCTVPGYRDWYDVMGTSWSHLGSLNAPHAWAMGALTSSTSPEVASPTRAVLRPMASLSGVRSLQITDGSVTYWVELRSATGRDAWLSSNYQGLEPGVTVRRSDPTDTNGSLLLDGSPSSTVNSSDWKSPVPVGSSLRVASGRYVIRVESVTSSGAQVAIGVDGAWPSTEPVQLSSPAPGARTASGSVTVTGVGTAHEGTLLYEVTDGSGAVVADGFVDAGANGALGPFSLALPLGAGSYTVAVWAPDESGGEGSHGARPFEVRRSFTVG